MHNAHPHTRDMSWRSVDDDDDDDQDTTSTTSPAFEVRLESDQLCQNHSVVHSLTGCNEHSCVCNQITGRLCGPQWLRTRCSAAS